MTDTTEAQAEYRYLSVESHDDHAIVRIVLNRPEARNAQNRGLLVELDHAFLAAEADDRVRVVILAGAGPSFSAGHDLGSEDRKREAAPGPDQHLSYRTNGATRPGAEARYRQEWHYYLHNTKRWRELRKVTIAQVHGNVISAGLMLMWACDLIVAAEDTRFADVVATRLGMCGVEYFAHPWEFGPRVAKELLLTGDAIDAERAYALGMVNKVLPRDTLADQTLAFARRIAELPTMTSLLVKDSVNQSVDAMGFPAALNAAYTIHELNHAHWAEVSGGTTYNGTPEFGVPEKRGLGWAEKGRP
jgi:enoyl-CoA hydratase